MRNVVRNAEIYEWYIKAYDAKAYIKGTTKVLKNNILLRYAPEIFAFDRKGKETIMEALIDISYESPNHFSQKLTALTGTRLKSDDIFEHALQFLNINIYNPTSIDDQILMPFAKGADKYYNYQYENSIDTLGMRLHQISIKPKWKSPKLLSARAHVVDSIWSIAYLEASGKHGLADFHIKVHFSTFNETFLLPIKTELFMEMKVLGNHIQNKYLSVYDYSSVTEWGCNEREKRKDYDISEHYNIQLDSAPIIKDSLFWANNRPISLSEDELSIYNKRSTKIDTADLKKSNLWLSDSWRFSKLFFEPRRFSYKETNFRYSGFLNPLKIGYSSNKGVSYSQRLILERRFKTSGRELGFRPDIGYLFKRKELIGQLPLRWLYLPQKMGEFSMSVGIGNRGLNSRIIEQIDEYLKDSTSSFQDYKLDYYKDYYAGIKNTVELFNGLTLSTRLTYHYREPVSTEPGALDGEEGTVTEIVDLPYRTFEPAVSFSWTPGQYYRMEGKKKIPVGSRLPSLSVEYSRGIKGVMKSEGNFERLELDIQQRIPLRFLCSLQYYAGAGIFTNSDELYFVDFSNFTRHNFPESWKDKIGGTFQLLNDYWYNASKSYIQGHIMYESPFFILNLFKNASKYVFSERLYLSQLYLPGVLPSYTEIGYGIGNYFFNIGVFASFEELRYQRIGVKFAFELFN